MAWAWPEALRWVLVKRLLLIAAACWAAATAAAAQTPAPTPVPAVSTMTASPAAAALPVPHPSPDVTNRFFGPFWPFLDAYDMDSRGLMRYPFDPEDGYTNGKAYQVWTRVSRQFSEGSRGVNHAAGGLRLDQRLAGDFYYSKFRAGSFRFNRAADWLSAHATADLSAGDRTTFEYGFGFATLQGDRSLVGPSAEVKWERQLPAPWTLYGRYALNFLTDNRFWHEASIGAGPSWKRLGVEAGYRVLLNPLRNSYGPEVALRLWL